jgi:hypothetical protein
MAVLLASSAIGTTGELMPARRVVPPLYLSRTDPRIPSKLRRYFPNAEAGKPVSGG